MGLERIVQSGIIGASEGASTEEAFLSFTYAWSPFATVVLCFLIVVSIFIVFKSFDARTMHSVRSLLTALRVVALFLIVFMALEVTRRPHEIRLPRLLLCFDDSLSMRETDVDELDAPKGSTSRLRAATNAFLANRNRMLNRLMDEYRLDVETIGSELSFDDIEDLANKLDELRAHRETSPLGNFLLRAIRQQVGDNTAAVVFLSDGLATDGSKLTSAATVAAKYGIPVYPVLLGDPNGISDIEIVDVVADRIAFTGEVISFDVFLGIRNVDVESFDVRLLDRSTNEILDTKQFGIAENADAVVRLTHLPPSEGTFHYVIETQLIEQDNNRTNNRRSISIEVRDELLRVLLVQHSASYEYRFLKSILERGNDDGTRTSLSLTSVLQDADHGFSNVDQVTVDAFPPRDILSTYHVILFGDVDPSLLGSLALHDIEYAVRQNSSGIVFIAGPKFMPMSYQGTPLESLLPYTTQSPIAQSVSDVGFSFELTQLGKRFGPMHLLESSSENTTLWNELPAMYWRISGARLKSGVQMLATLGGDYEPGLTFHYAGSGKVMFHFFDSTWRWRGNSEQTYMARYWLQTIRFLARQKLNEHRSAELFARQVNKNSLTAVEFKLKYYSPMKLPSNPQPFTAVMESDNGKIFKAALSQDPWEYLTFTGSSADLPPGKYRAWIAELPPVDSPSAEFTVHGRGTELARRNSDRQTLSKVAEITGGELLELRELSELHEKLPRGRALVTRTSHPVPIWNSHWVALIFLLVLTSDWLIRRRQGFP